MTVWAPSAEELERRRIRSSLRRRRLLIASTVTVVVFGGLGFGITHSPGWTRVHETFFSWSAAKSSFPSVIDGFWKNVALFMLCEPVILLVAILVAVVRGTTSPWLMPTRIVAIVYTDLFRGIPTLIVAYLIVIGVPALNLRGLPNSFFWLAFVSLVLSYGAYVAEVIRSGMESVHPSQWASAWALGLTHGQAVRHVVLPQAIRRVIPPLLNDFASLQKDTSLVGVVGVIEALRAANIYASFNFNYTPYVVASVLFIALTIPLARFTDALIRRQQRREWAGAL